MSNQLSGRSFSKIKNKMPTMLTRGKPMFEDVPTSESDMEIINQLAPGNLSSEQVFIRSMYLCSSQPCLSDGCQFTRNALDEIAQRVVGLSVLTGHDRSSLPIARFFKAEVVQSDLQNSNEPVFFVRAWFYWLRNTSGAKDLLLNIDGGIYREVSLAWKFDAWSCSICRSPNGRCGHRAGALYNEQRCYRLIDHITEVLEGSLVYKSADRNTYLSGERSEDGFVNDNPVLIVGDGDDPLLDFLEKRGLLQERNTLDDISDALSKSADLLWIRSATNEDMLQTANTLLQEDGACLGEILSDCSNKNAEAVSIAAVTRQDQGSLSVQTLHNREA